MPSIKNQFLRSQAKVKVATFSLSHQLLVVLSALLLCGSALAQRSDGPSGGRHDNIGDSRGNGGKHSRGPGRQGPARAEMRGGAYFQDRQRSAVHDYYGNHYRAGRCPPGLSRKHNGCMPPGQIRYYRVGQRLAPAVIYHTVPAAMVVTLGVPPSGHRYVRVASDILLIAIGTGLVVDAIQDLGGM